MFVGIDSVEIARFAYWHLKSQKQLYRIFSDEEIAYSLAQPILSAQRFAVRFAVREAFYKAVNQLAPPITSYLTVCKAIAVAHHEHGFPYLIIDWDLLGVQAREISIALTHSKTIATAVVFLAALKK